jgi:hypothetical protein
MKRIKEYQILKCLTLILSLLLLLSCSKKCSTEPDDTGIRWKEVEVFENEHITSIYVNSNRTQLSITTARNYAKFTQGNTEPDIIIELEISDDESHIKYIPSFSDEFYFYCESEGQTMYIGNNTTGEFIGTLPIESIVDTINLPAKYSPSEGINISNHIEHNSNGLYMISLRQTDLNPNNHQDDRLIFGNFVQQGNTLNFNILQNIESYDEPSMSAIVYSNYYYGGNFWQYRRGDHQISPVTVINEETFSKQNLTFYPKIRNVFEGEGYTVGLFDAPLKKSFDGGFTWEDWMMLNAGWHHVAIQNTHVFFYSHNYASINFETLEIINYDRGELDGSCIVGMIEFDDKVYAATLNGLFFCSFDDFFIEKTESSRNWKDDLRLELLPYEE